MTTPRTDRILLPSRATHSPAGPTALSHPLPLPFSAKSHCLRRVACALVTALCFLWARPAGQAQVAAGGASPVHFGNRVHQALGTATLIGSDNGLVVTNIGITGPDGVAVNLEELSRTASVRFAPVSLTGSPARRFRVTVHGAIDGASDRLLGSLVLSNRPAGVILSLLDTPTNWINTVQLEVYRNSQLAASLRLRAGEGLAVLSGDVQLAATSVGGDTATPTGQMTWEIELSASVGITNSSGQGATGNRIRVVAALGNSRLENLARVSLTAANLDAFLIREESAPQFQPRLEVMLAGPQLRLNWDTRSAVLLQSTQANGPWSPVTSNTNRLTLNAGGGQRFFEVRTDPTEPCRTFPNPALGYTCKRNILLVVMDDVGSDQIPVYTSYYNRNAITTDDVLVLSPPANPAARTPTIERLAASGVTFLNAWACPTCSPTRASLFTGTSSFRHGVYNPSAPRLGTNATTIARVLGNAGYVNGLFGKWHLGADASHLPVGFGWNFFQGSLDAYLPDYYNWPKDVTFLNGTNTVWITTNITNYATFENREDALAWIRSRNRPWMASVTFNASHWANNGAGNYFQAPPAGSAYQTRVSTEKGMYRSMLECLDRSLTNLLTGIDPAALEQTTIFVMGDNGTEPEISDHFPDGKNKGSLFEGGIHVPLIVADGYTFLRGTQSPWNKGLGRVISPGRFETNVVQTQDIFATAAEIGQADGSCGVDSVSLVPYLNSPSAPAQRAVAFAETFANGRWNVAVRNATHKLIVNGYCGPRPTYALYDLVADRWETTVIPEDGTSPIATQLLADLAALVAVPTLCPITPEYPVPTICP